MTATIPMSTLQLIACLSLFGNICGGERASMSLYKIVDTAFHCDEVKGSVIIRGEHVKFSEFTKDNGELRTPCKSAIKSVSIFSTAGVTLDRNVRAAGVKMLVLAPTWSIIGSKIINLNGQKHVEPRPTHPKKNHVRGENGVHGDPGLPGNLGGNFVGIGDEFINGEALTISVSGGDGQDGGDGGDGGDGEDGLYADKDEINLECFLKPECNADAKETRTRSNKGKMRTFDCHLVEHESSITTRYCKFIIRGDSGRPSGSGGNSGPGGKPGNRGNVLLTELGVTSGIKTISDVGRAGKDGKVGKSGQPGSNGYDAVYSFKSTLGVSYTKPVRSYEENPMVNGVNGVVNYNKAIPAEPHKEIDLSEVANVVVEYKQHLLESINASDPNDLRLKFYNKIDKSKSILSMFDTLALVSELKVLEKQFHKLHGSLDFLPLYKSLLNRTAEYAKQPNSKSRKSAEHKKVLTYLYTTILGREYNLKDRSESNLIVDIGEYLDLVKDDIKKYRESSKIQKTESYRKNYETNIELKTKEAHDFINNDILPALENALKENVQNMDSVLEKIIELEDKSKGNIQELGEKKAEFQEKLMMSMVCDCLSLVGKIASVFPGVGGVVSVGIEMNVGMVEDAFGLNKEVNIPPPSNLIEGAQGVGKQVIGLRNEAVSELKERIEFSIEALNKYPDEFADLIDEINDIKNRLKQVVDMKGISQLREELYQALARKQDQTSKESNMKTLAFSSLPNFWTLVPSYNNRQLMASGKKKPKGKKNPDEEEKETTINTLPALMMFGPALFTIVKKYNEKQETLRKFSEAIAKEKEFLNQLREYENSVRNEMGPALDMMASSLLNTANSLGGKSQVSLDVTKWQLQSKLKKMHLGVQDMIKGLNVSELFKNTFGKVEDALNTLIGVYDRIQSFQEEQNWANYIADINSAGSQSIKVNDRKLQSALDYLNLIIDCNTVIQQYQTVVDAFKQYVFPFADLFFAELVLPDNLNYGEDLDGLVLKAETQINHIKKKFDEYRFVAKRYDSYIGSGTFNSKYRSTRPFFVWDQGTHREMISKLFSGETVIVYADVKKSTPRYDAVKFNEMEINFKAKDKKTQSSIDKVLRDFHISAYHTGNSYFRTNDQYFLITTGKLEFWYNFEKDKNGQPVRQSDLIRKVKNGAYMLSPYATWELTLSHTSERNRRAFQVLNKYKEVIDVELIGHGHFVFKDKLEIDIKIEQYYTPIYSNNMTKP